MTMLASHGLVSFGPLMSTTRGTSARTVGAAKVAPSPLAPANPNAERMGCATPSPPVASARRDTQVGGREGFVWLVIGSEITVFIG